MWAAPCLALLLLVGAPSALGQWTTCSPEVCEQCSADQLKCEKCQPGYHVDAQGACVRCRDPLADTCTATRTLTCQTFNSLAPNSEMLYLNHKTGMCTACPGLIYQGPCKTCGPDGKCAKCNDGHYMNNQGLCKSASWAGLAKIEVLHPQLTQECPPLCRKCNALGCIECEDEYWEDEYAYFPTCAVYKDAAGRCQKCTAHAYDTGCTKCDEKGRCTECGQDDASRVASDGATVLDAKAGRCVKCTDPLCGKCDPQKPSKCAFCAKEPYWGYWDTDYGVVYRDSRTGKCESCFPHTVEKGCLECNGRGECTRCLKDNMRVLRGGRCVPCSAFIDFCEYCGSEGKTCLSCTQGYGLEASKCVPCP
ncbi:hypothetical protein ABPG75_013021 [Micractinium tetrahymenae]